MTHILIIGKTLNSPAMLRAAREAGVRVSFLPSAQSHRLPEGFDDWDYDVLLAGLDHGDHAPVTGSRLLETGALVAPVAGENIAAGVTSLSEAEVERLNAYFAYGGPENLRSGLTMLDRLSGKKDWTDLPAPRPVLLDAIYTFDGGQYESLDGYFREAGRRYGRYVGILSYRGRFNDGDLEVERAIAESLNRRGIGVITAYSEGTPDKELGTLPFEEVIGKFFCRDGKPEIELLINFQFLGTKGDGRRTMFEKAADCFAALNLPVIRPAVFSGDEETWRRERRPYSRELPANFVLPELQGMIETVHIGHTDGMHLRRPEADRVERLTGRIAKWLDLRTLENREKRVVIMLHNAPCSGGEANIGQATDMDAFASAAAILRRMKDEGYRVENLPEDGEELRRKIFAHRAYSDFRWTSAEDIRESGGVLFEMTEAEYRKYYNDLSAPVRRAMEASWGPAPGSAMTVNGKLLITGLPFGNVLLMVQPKRGCYGAKCSGEVCRILQDPDCPPTHQYLATYWYLQKIWRANAVIHLGTHGSLEFLPGKDCGLGGECFPDIAIGDLPNLYPYCASIVGQALTAKRRGYAVTLSHLPAPGRGLDAAQRRLSDLIRRYFEAQAQENGQEAFLREELTALCAQSEAARKVLARETDFDEAMRELRGMFLRTAENRRGSARHIFGACPDRQTVTDYIAEEWLAGSRDTAAVWEAFGDAADRETKIVRLIGEALGDRPETERPSSGTDLPPEIRRWFLEDAARLSAELERSGKEEMDSLMRALSGGYIRPGRGGEAGNGGREILPTGRNLYGVETDRIPTEAAYARGRQAAEDLIALYRREEGRMPEKVAMNMTSLDITRTGGEQLGQFLGLLGVRPVWDGSGRVEGLEVISLEELGRPRVDVTAKISSVMRDAWPDVPAMMDRAVRMAAGLPESDGDNPVRANSRRIGASGEYADGRVFGSRPGTYSSALGLALKASAWKEEEDLAKYFLDSNAYVYGENREGERALKAFAENVRQIDLTSDITASRRTDAGASSYGARVQGGFRMAARALGSRKMIRQYTGESGSGRAVRVVSSAEHVRKAIEDTLMNDVWTEQEMADGYRGGAEMMERLRNIFEIQCVCENIENSTLDELARRYLTDEKMRGWFAENNPYALEEAGRRFLELNRRGKWRADPEVLRELRRAYLQAEGDMEDRVSGAGEVQGSDVEIVTPEQEERWKARLREADGIIKKTPEP